MEQKTQIQAEDGKQEIFITRAFDLPVSLLFRAYTEPELLAQWMGTHVVKLENRKSGSWEFETKDPAGNVAFSASGVIHEFIPDRKIIRTFQMNNALFDVQLEFLEFEALSETSSKLTIQTIYRSVALRDQQLKLPFAQGINWAHNRLEQVLKNN